MRVIILLALFVAAMAAPERVQRIVGGSPTTVNRHPYMANVQYHVWNLFWEQWCGGTLISSRSVLSAAHCFHEERVDQWRVRLGTSYASSGGQVYHILRIVSHEHFSRPTMLNNDIAVIHLASNAILSANVYPISIAGINYIPPDGTLVATTGWGALQSEGSSSKQLQTVDISIINQELCAERYADLKTQPGFAGWPDITEVMLCTGILDIGGKGACQGDSGGPVVHENSVLVGIISWGHGCADSFYPAVNARVSALADWVVANSI